MAKARSFQQHSVKVTLVTKSTAVVKCASHNSALHSFSLSHDAKYLFVVHESLQSSITRLLINIILQRYCILRHSEAQNCERREFGMCMTHHIEVYSNT